MRTELLQLANRLVTRGEPFVLATVVRREAPTSAQLGDAAVITGDGEFHGWLGGACTKDLIVREAAAVLERGAPRLVLLTADPDAATRNGVRVLPMTCHSGGTVEVYLDPQIPRRRLILFGESDVAESIARLAPEIGFDVERRTVDGEALQAPSPGEAPDSGASAEGVGAGDDAAAPTERPHVVIATYGEHDESSLARALTLDPEYMAVVSSRRRFEAMRETLLAGGTDADALDRVSSPAGLDIGARTPGEIAVSILAEMIERRRAGEGAAGLRPATPRPATAVDPVCGMTVSTDVPHRAVHEGTAYYFCCDGCRQRFLATPEMFTSRYAG